jgi:hypothetical protein
LHAPVRAITRARQVLNKELLEAAEYGNVSGIQRLVEMGADVNYAEIDPDFAYTPLIMAATTGAPLPRFFLCRARARARSR